MRQNPVRLYRRGLGQIGTRRLAEAIRVPRAAGRERKVSQLLRGWTETAKFL